jgi:hypothetical protein
MRQRSRYGFPTNGDATTCTGSARHVPSRHSIFHSVPDAAAPEGKTLLGSAQC